MAELGDLEAAVMSLLWDAPAPRTVREVLLTLQAERDIAYTTVMTVMDRLFKKGHLSRTSAGNAFSYAPTASRADYTATLMAGALDASDDRTAALVHFTSRLTVADTDALRRALDRST